ncbi:MAG TPA: primary-amine oxidase [Pyrinomonadaceae bacterium]|nr:primary-amine oxidase [Pyrinomonadaceae bacterium]
MKNYRRVLTYLQKVVLFSLFVPLVSVAAAAETAHPLDALSAEEISNAVKVLQTASNFPKTALFSTVVLNEPPKAEVLNFKPGAKFRREAFAIILDRERNKTYEGVVDLRAGKVLSWKEIAGVQPLVFQGEYEVLQELVKADPRWQAAIRKRGITDFEQVAVDGWAVGQVPERFTGRLLRGLSYFKGESANYYRRPIEGIVAIVNMNSRKVVDVTDTGVVPISRTSQDFDEKSVGKLREKPKPLVITQPEGASYQIDGQEVVWQKWRFRYTMHPREGLVLHTIRYDDDGKTRPILYRASLSEMVVPYGDPDENWRWRAAFDVGEYSVGRLASPLEPKLDAPENAALINATFADDEGKPYELENAVGIYERDGGILWKHYDSVSGKNETRRARDLVMFFIATIGNYDYAVNYIFKQDGSMEVDLALTGIMLAKGVREKRADSDHNSHNSMQKGATGHLVAENIVAPHHQHFFSFRLDFDVDGTNNSVTELNTSAMPAGANNPFLNGFLMRETMFRTEGEAQRKMDMQAARVWSVMNPAAKNSLGHNTSFILVPGANSLPFIAPEASVRKRAGFINNHFWATRYNAQELSAAGVYPNQSKGGDGLPQFVANNEAIENTDVVVWYTLGVTHIPRPEEWAVMPVTHVGFKMIPGAFFSRNPALDVPK